MISRKSPRSWALAGRRAECGGQLRQQIGIHIEQRRFPLPSVFCWSSKSSRWLAASSGGGRAGPTQGETLLLESFTELGPSDDLLLSLAGEDLGQQSGLALGSRGGRPLSPRSRVRPVRGSRHRNTRCLR
jgi:hypothetical protein